MKKGPKGFLQARFGKEAWEDLEVANCTMELKPVMKKPAAGPGKKASKHKTGSKNARRHQQRRRQLLRLRLRHHQRRQTLKMHQRRQKLLRLRQLKRRSKRLSSRTKWS